MKLGKSIGTILLCLLLLLSTALALATGLLRFVVLNPAFYRTFTANQPYCNELRVRIGENLDHIAILYGLPEGSLTDVVTDEEIRAYTAALIDALFSADANGSLQLPTYPASGFAEYLRTHTAYSEQAIADFSEDCAASVSEDFAALNIGLLVSGFVQLRDSRLALLSPILGIAALALTAVLIAMLLTMHNETPRVGAVAVFGGLFMGVTTLFVPLLQLWMFDYIGRLNISFSAFRTILSGLLNTALYGCLAVAGTLFVLMTLLLLFACGIAAKGKKAAKRKSR